MKDSIKILLVEDDPMVMKINQMLFERLGYTPYCATNGKEALSLAEENIFDVIFTDIGLPDIDGITMVSKIRKHERRYRPYESKIYAFTAYDLENVKQRGLEVGMNGVFNKPMLIDNVKQLLEHVAKD